MKIGIIGVGKRFLNVYHDVLTKFNTELFVWNRTNSKSKQYCDSYNQNLISNLKEFENLELDLCLCFIPSQKSYDILSEINLKCVLLIETPVEDQRWCNKDNVGVLEQWPYLPTEQFKEMLYKKGVLSRPYWVFNDGRSLDYHAIAQLRKYKNHAEPKDFRGLMQDVKHEGFVDKNGNLNHTSDFWTHGQVVLEDNTILMHSFTYNCKQTLLKSIQLLRACSKDGSLMSGRINELDNDYEMFEVRYLDKGKNVIVEKVKRESSGVSTLSLSIQGEDVIWVNPYTEHGFNDQQTAIATVIHESVKGNIYTAKNGFIDVLTITGIKKAAQSNSILKLG